MSTDSNREMIPTPGYDFTQPESPLIAQESIRVRPTALTIISVLAILGGIVGVLGGVFGLVQLLLGQWLAEAFTPQVGPDAELQQQLQEKINAVNNQFLIPNIISTLALAVLGGLLLYGGIGLLRWKLSAADLLRKVVLFGIFFEIGRMILAGSIQYKMVPLITEQVTASMKTNDGNPAGESLSQFVMIAMIATGVVWAFWVFAKIGLMIWARSYLGRPSTRELLS